MHCNQVAMNKDKVNIKKNYIEQTSYQTNYVPQNTQGIFLNTNSKTKCKFKVPFSEKMSLRNKAEIRTVIDKQKLRYFVKDPGYQKIKIFRIGNDTGGALPI